MLFYRWQGQNVQLHSFHDASGPDDACVLYFRVDQVILAETVTGVGTRWHSMQSFGDSKITWAGFGLMEGCNRRKCFYCLFIEMECILLVFPTYNWIQFGRDCKDWKYKDLKLKWCGQRIWSWGKTGRQNSSSRLNLIDCSFVSLR